jgi:4-hydroxybenzoate polyprenyltransferase
MASLWFYSTSLKRAFLIGNGMVALLTAMIPVLVGLYEIPLLERAYVSEAVQVDRAGTTNEATFHFSVIWYWILAYAAFAFLGTLVRELQKDMADIRGDKAEGCRTLPIVMGMRWAKAFALIYIATIVGALLAVRSFLLNDDLSFWFIGVGIIAPLLVSAGFTFQATDRRGFTTAGNLMKLAMVMAVGYSAFIRYIL